MTRQIPDYINYQNEEYRVIGINGHGLPSMRTFNVSPTAVHASCWRGYYMGYSVTNKRLVTNLLAVMGQVNRIIDGIEPQPVSNCKQSWCATEWRGLNRQTPFTGKLLIGKHLLKSMHVGAGFQKPAAYLYVHELDFKDGVLHNVADISSQMALIREKILNVAYRNQAVVESAHEINTWTKYKLSLNYDAWWWN